jgi:tetratricopeptide (TPR) repeat protein
LGELLCASSNRPALKCAIFLRARRGPGSSASYRLKSDAFRAISPLRFPAAAPSHAVALDPNNADARLFVSITLRALGRGKESLNYVRSAFRLNSHPSTLYLTALGLSYYVLGQFEEAIEAYQSGVELRPLFPPNHLCLAIAYLRLERIEKALAAWRTHLALTNGRPLHHVWIEETLRTAHTTAVERLDQLVRC